MSTLIPNSYIEQKYLSSIYIKKILYEMQRANPSKQIRKQNQIFFIFRANYMGTQIDIIWHFIFRHQTSVKIQFINNSCPGRLTFNFFQQRLYTQTLHIIKIINQLKISNGMKILLSPYGSICTQTIIPPWIIQNKVIEYINSLKITMDNVAQYLLPYLSLSSTRFNQNQQQKSLNILNRIYQIKRKYQRFRVKRQEFCEIQFEQVSNKARKLIESTRILVQCMSQQPIIKSNHSYKYISHDQIKQSIERHFIHEKEEQSKQTLQKQNIMTGLKIMSVLQNIKQPNLLPQGNHSRIQINKYKYQISLSINQIISFPNQQMKKCQYKEKNIFEGYLVKKIPLQKQVSMNSFRNQIAFLKFIRNNNCQYIANYYLQLSQQKQELYISYYNQTLYEYSLKQKKRIIYLSIKKKLRLLRQLVQGVRFLSLKWICHRDLKPSNIMISRQFKPKIIDFGSAVPVFRFNSFNPQDKRLLGSKGYYYDYDDCSQRTQELYKNLQQYQQHLYFDSFSLGKIFNFIFENLQGTKMNTQEIIMQVIKYIIQRCSEEDPNNRLSVQQILVLVQELQEYYKDQYELLKVKYKKNQAQQCE